MVRLKAQFHRAQGHETAHKQTGREQQREGEGNLENNHGIANTRAPGRACDAFAGVSHGVGEVAARGLESGKESTEEGCSPGEKRALDEQLADEANATGTQCGSNREFSFASNGASEQQIGYVATADEQKEPDSAAENE
jgi:hypothetical protein